ncbi:MAG: tRNA pseudouridine(38-40) synthase TruA [Acidobacteria bacterium]|nr:tRNA pseudouridine(38-40) synthase TruA [Acidobacteriota bacterium]MBU4493845.1 tRNA pseudouridine(38-40) synthase TruA [Acidobacteriota bacterium]
MKTFKAVCSYDGTDYHGWQRQPKGKTIQGVLENTLIKITKKNIAVIGAGRTDAGVHALGQVFHFQTAARLQPDEFQRAFNSLLPPDVRISRMDEAPDDFHARRSARSKVYRYRILNSPSISPFAVRYVHPVHRPLDVESMTAAARLFVREDDFNPFSSNRFLHPVRRITRAEISQDGDEILLTVEAGGFLRYMVRTIAGTLIEVGSGRLEPADIDRLFAQKKRTEESPTAPAKGLCLIEVKYGPDRGSG